MLFLLLFCSMFFVHMQAVASDVRYVLLNKHETMALTLAEGNQIILAAPECTQFSFLLEKFRDGVREIELKDIDKQSFEKLRRWVHIRKSCDSPFKVALALLHEIDLKWHRPSVNALLHIMGAYLGAEGAQRFANLFDVYISPDSNCLPGGECDMIMKELKVSLKQIHSICFNRCGDEEQRVNGALGLLIAHELEILHQSAVEDKLMHCARLLGAPSYIIDACCPIVRARMLQTCPIEQF